MSTYDETRKSYKPANIIYLLIAESPPPADPTAASSRQFYRAEYQKSDDRLYANTMRAVFADANELESKDLEANKLYWLQRFQQAGFYMIEALEQSQVHEVTKKERQAKLSDHAERVVERVGELATDETKVILIKSNVFEMLAEPLRAAGFAVLNEALLDYPGRFNQRDYREKLAALIASS